MTEATTTNNAKRWFDVGKKATITFECAGDLIVRGHTEASLVMAGKEAEFVEVNGTIVTSSSDLKVLVPRKATIIVNQVAGDFRIKNVKGNIEVTSDISGDAVIVAVGGTVTLNKVHGDLKARDVSKSLAVSDVTGDIRARRVGNVTANKVFGDVELGKVTGDIEINEIYGDAALNGVVGDVTLAQVNGDCVVGDLGGKTAVTSRDDIRIQGPLTVGAHEFKAGSTISMRWPKDNDLLLTARAPEILNSLLVNDAAKTEEGGLSASLGEGNVVVSLEAAERITLKPIMNSENEESWDGHIESEFDFTGLAEQIISEVNTRMDEAVDRLPQFTSQAETIMRQTEDAINKMLKQADLTRENIQQRATGQRPKRAKRARPTNAAETENANSGSGAARLKVLKMLEEGKITVKEASELLAALE